MNPDPVADDVFAVIVAVIAFALAVILAAAFLYFGHRILELIL